MKKIHGKPLDSSFLKVKSNYYTSNELFLERTKADAQILLRQPVVPRCLICYSLFDAENTQTYTRHGLDYYQCNTCGHFNCTRHATVEFAEYLYSDNDYTQVAYASAFESQQALEDRLNVIDRPKTRMYLEHMLPGAPSDYFDGGWLDIGCGSGFTLYTLHEYGLKNLHGIDYSPQQLANARSILPDSVKLDAVDNDSFLSSISSSSAKVYSLIGVLEHLLDPNLVVKTLSQNPLCEHVLVSVPAFSLSTFIELAGDNTWARQLSSSHTHLFSSQSLLHLFAAHGFAPFSSWNYGQDAFDLVRLLAVESSGNLRSRSFIIDKLSPLIQPLQQLIDDSELSSEIMYVFSRQHCPF